MAHTKGAHHHEVEDGEHVARRLHDRHPLVHPGEVPGLRALNRILLVHLVGFAPEDRRAHAPRQPILGDGEENDEARGGGDAPDAAAG